MKNYKKSQTEIMGLAIIIILVSLAMLFVIQFIILKQPSDIKKTFTHKELAANTVNTLLSTTTDCRELSVSQLLNDCAEGGYTRCPVGFSCDYVEIVIQEILQQTLEQWSKQHYLTVKINNEEVIPPLGDPCKGEKTTSSPCCILPTSYAPMKINLDICG
ncbi:hypothetical protein GOV06_00705 [Candidatus Woesearchaeota archaeon]|nr:hypothetical protein [Candidatus Woesearchaeota archaeon]